MRAFDAAIRAIYDASVTPEAWPVALDKIGALFGAPGAVIYFVSADGQVDFIASDGVQDAVRIYQEENWGPRDVHAQRLPDLHLGGYEVVNDQLLVTEEEIETLPIYTDFFARVGFGWLMTCPILPDLDILVTLTVTRAKDAGPFTDAEMETLHMVGRHVEQALRVSLRVANLEAMETIQRAALDVMDVAILGLDDPGRLVFANASGEAVFPGLFVIVEGCVAPRSEDEAARFDALIHAARTPEEAGAAPRCIVLTGLEGRRAAVWAAALPPERAWPLDLGTPARTLLIVSPLSRDTRLDPTVVRDAFQLSLGEARLAALIGDGVALGTAAERLGVTEGTARVVLKRVFRKLGVNRQGELVARLAALSSVGGRAHQRAGSGPAVEVRRRHRD